MPEFEPSSHVWAEGPWASHLTSLCLRMGIIKLCCLRVVIHMNLLKPLKELRMMPGTCLLAKNTVSRH